MGEDATPAFLRALQGSFLAVVTSDPANTLSSGPGKYHDSSFIDKENFLLEKKLIYIYIYTYMNQGIFKMYDTVKFSNS